MGSSPEKGKIANRDKRRNHSNITKLTVENVKIIKKMLSEDKKQNECARLFGVSQGTIASIKKEKTWRDIEYE